MTLLTAQPAVGGPKECEHGADGSPRSVLCAPELEEHDASPRDCVPTAAAPAPASATRLSRWQGAAKRAVIVHGTARRAAECMLRQRAARASRFAANRAAGPFYAAATPSSAAALFDAAACGEAGRAEDCVSCVACVADSALPSPLSISSSADASPRSSSDISPRSGIMKPVGSPMSPDLSPRKDLRVRFVEGCKPHDGVLPMHSLFEDMVRTALMCVMEGSTAGLPSRVVALLNAALPHLPPSPDLRVLLRELVALLDDLTVRLVAGQRGYAPVLSQGGGRQLIIVSEHAQPLHTLRSLLCAAVELMTNREAAAAQQATQGAACGEAPISPRAVSEPDCSTAVVGGGMDSTP